MVENINAVNNAAQSAPAQKIKRAYQMPQAPRGDDVVEIKSEAMTVRSADQARLEKIMAIREQVQNGTYLTEEKLNVALDGAIDDAFKTV